MLPAAVLFDVDDTLLDTRRSFREGLQAFLGSRGLPVSTAVVDRALARWVADEGGHFARYTRGEIDFAEQRRHRFDDLLAMLDEPRLDDASAEVAELAYRRGFESGWRLHDDALPCLDALAGLPLGVVTNVDTAYQSAKLDRVGVLDRFRVVVGVDQVTVGKPEAAIFRLACARLGVLVGDTVYVGDQRAEDAEGARNAGLRAVWLDRRADPTPSPAGVQRIAGLADLAALLT